MNDDAQPGPWRRQREIRAGEVDPARSAFIDELLRRRADQAAEWPRARQPKRPKWIAAPPSAGSGWPPGSPPQNSRFR